MVSNRRLTRTLLGERGIGLPTDKLPLRLALPFVEKNKEPAVTKPHPVVSSKDLPKIRLDEVHSSYMLNGDETKLLEKFMETQELVWIVAVPMGNTEADKAIRKRFNREDVVVLRGQPLYIFKDAHAFAGAAKATRFGKTLHVWAEPMAEYEIIDDAGDTAERKLPHTVASGAKNGRVREKPGILWTEDYVVYGLDDLEIVICSTIPERVLMWMVPISEEEQKDWEALKKRYDSKELVKINGMLYHVFSGEEGVGGAKRMSRVGNALHLWADARTDYELLGECDTEETPVIKVKPGKVKGVPGIAWENAHVVYELDGVEEKVVSGAMPENTPMWIVAIPDDEMKDPVAMADKFGWTGIFTLNKATYRAYEGERQEPDARHVLRTGNRLRVWSDEEEKPIRELGERRFVIKAHERGQKTQLTDNCVAIAGEKTEGGKTKVIYVYHTATEAYQEVIVMPGSKQILFSDEGALVLIKGDKHGERVLAEVSGGGKLLTKKLKTGIPDNFTYVSVYSALHSERKWTRSLTSGHTLHCKSSVSRAKEGAGAVIYKLTDRNNPYFERTFMLKFGPGVREECIFVLGNDVAFTISASNTKTKITEWLMRK